MLLYLNQNFYQLTTSGYWYEWSGVVWNKVTDPRVTNGNIGYVPAPATDIGPAIVDSGKNVWFLASNEVLYVNGKEAGSNYNTNYVFYFNGNIYCANTSSEWYQWKGSSWTRIAGNPTKITSNPTPTPTPTPNPSPSPTAPNGQSIKNYGAKCDGKTDDSAAAQRALNAAANNAFTLLIDCPLFLDIGSDDTKVLMIDNGTTIDGTGGSMTVTNVLNPAFAIVNSTGVTIKNLKVLYTGVTSATVDPRSIPFITPSNHTFLNWLALNRGIKLCANLCSEPNTGLNNDSAIFLFMGSTNTVDVENVSVTATGREPDEFVFTVFSFSLGYRSNGSYTGSPLDSNNQPYPNQTAVPSGLTFKNITLDGTLMGFVGGLQNAAFDTIVSNRYSDLETDQGTDIGGVGEWSAPPHLFYFSYFNGPDKTLANNNITINNVLDNGIRIGTPRDTPQSGTRSGSAQSLKFNGNNSSITNYTTYRPDGAMLIDACDNVKFENITAYYNSSFQQVFSSWRWGIVQGQPMENLTFTNINFYDQAEKAMKPPMENLNGGDPLAGIDFAGVTLNMISWGMSNTLTEASSTVDGQTANSLRIFNFTKPPYTFKVGP